MDTIDHISTFLINKGYKLSPVSEEQVEKLELEFSVKFPKTYRKFLLKMGKSAGDFMKGSSVFYNEISGIREGAEELVTAHQLKPLPQNAFVFWMHQGYQFAFFIANDDDDPAVYYYSEGKHQLDYIKITDTVSDFFKGQMADL